ncbi:MAG: Asp-tRNA(Asn)/Glu-tRNA(Gln) amidotransferase subunit GatC [Pseudomonadota bacterium]
MTLELSDVNRLAILAQLELSDEQAAGTLEKLNGIFVLVEQLCAVDTEGVHPLRHPLSLVQPSLAIRLREDVVTEADRREAFQHCAPIVQDGLYLVPKVID